MNKIYISAYTDNSFGTLSHARSKKTDDSTESKIAKEVQDIMDEAERIYAAASALTSISFPDATGMRRVGIRERVEVSKARNDGHAKALSEGVKALDEAISKLTAMRDTIESFTKALPSITKVPLTASKNRLNTMINKLKHSEVYMGK